VNHWRTIGGPVIRYRQAPSKVLALPPGSRRRERDGAAMAIRNAGIYNDEL